MPLYDYEGNVISSGSMDAEDFTELAANGGSIAVKWESGAMNISGTDVSSTTRIRTPDGKYIFKDSMRYLFITCPLGYKFQVASYVATTNTPSFVSLSDWYYSDTIIPHEAHTIYRLVLGNTDDTTFTTSDVPAGFTVIPVLYPVWASDAKGESINAFVTGRNNYECINEFMYFAETYWNNRNATVGGNPAMVYGQSTIFDNDTYTNQMDCSTLVGLCLRGIEFDDTPYATGVGRDRNSYYANPDLGWSINSFDYVIDGGRVRTAAALGQWMISQRRQVPLDYKLANVDVGDIVFFSRFNNSGQPVNPHRFMMINHVAIIMFKAHVTDFSASASYNTGDRVVYSGKLYQCTTAHSGAWDADNWDLEYNNWDASRLPYVHYMIESSGTVGESPTIKITLLEREWETSTAITKNNFNTISLVCRPDLGALAGGA